MAGAQRFRFREEPGSGDEPAVLEVRVPQVRAAAPTWQRPLVGARGVGEILPFSASFVSKHQVCCEARGGIKWAPVTRLGAVPGGRL